MILIIWAVFLMIIHFVVMHFCFHVLLLLAFVTHYHESWSQTFLQMLTELYLLANNLHRSHHWAYWWSAYIWFTNVITLAQFGQYSISRLMLIYSSIILQHKYNIPYSPWKVFMWFSDQSDFWTINDLVLTKQFEFI